MSKASAALQAAFMADPNALHALVCNRVPCNQELAEDPFVQVDSSPVLPDIPACFRVGALGLVNGVLEANGLPRVAAKFSDEVDAEGRRKMVGFCDYEPPAQNTLP